MRPGGGSASARASSASRFNFLYCSSFIVIFHSQIVPAGTFRNSLILCTRQPGEWTTFGGTLAACLQNLHRQTVALDCRSLFNLTCCSKLRSAVCSNSSTAFWDHSRVVRGRLIQDLGLNFTGRLGRPLSPLAVMRTHGYAAE